MSSSWRKKGSLLSHLMGKPKVELTLSLVTYKVQMVSTYKNWAIVFYNCALGRMKESKLIKQVSNSNFTFYFFFIFISWMLITLQYCSGFCHTLTWISHGFTCIPHPDPHFHLSLYPILLGFPSAPGPSTCLMHLTWAGDLFHPRYYTCFDADLSKFYHLWMCEFGGAMSIFENLGDNPL